MSMGPKPEGATTVFVLGLLSLIMCAPLGIFAWIYGNGYLSQCRAMGVEPDGLGVAGRILGMIACIFMLLGFCIGMLVMCAGVLGAAAGM
jgi:hypothetical protein